MMTLRTFCLVMSTILLRHVASSHALSGAATYLLIGGCVIFCVLGKALAVTAALRYPLVSKSQAWREFQSQRQALEWIWLVLQAWLLPASGLAQILSEAHALGWPNSLLIVAWFLPSLIFISALELSSAQLETHWNSHQPQGASTLLRERWWQRIRFGSVGAIMTCLVPVVVVLGFMDTIQAWWPAMPERWQAI
ncbi:MAG: hypothetical protein IT423_10825, partial [Pirellulaceae bacterium]|nr:hypothetical protein [Pirellulaceae bacterium]